LRLVADEVGTAALCRTPLGGLKTELLNSQNFSRILLIKPSALGDVVHTIPVLPKLRRRFPTAQIDWLITPGDSRGSVRHRTSQLIT